MSFPRITENVFCHPCKKGESRPVTGEGLPLSAAHTQGSRSAGCAAVRKGQEFMLASVFLSLCLSRPSPSSASVNLSVSCRRAPRAVDATRLAKSHRRLSVLRREQSHGKPLTRDPKLIASVCPAVKLYITSAAAVTCTPPRL